LQPPVSLQQNPAWLHCLQACSAEYLMLATNWRMVATTGFTAAEARLLIRLEEAGA